MIYVLASENGESGLSVAFRVTVFVFLIAVIIIGAAKSGRR